MYQNVVHPENDVDSRMALEQMRMGHCSAWACLSNLMESTQHGGEMSVSPFIWRGSTTEIWHSLANTC